MKARARAAGLDIIDFGMGNPDSPSPTHVVEKLVEAVQEEIDMINLGGPIAVVECKKLVRLVPQLSLEEGFEETKTWSKRMFQTEEATEGMAAFAQKRKPSWIEKTS